jgi:hypothetical protein
MYYRRAAAATSLNGGWKNGNRSSNCRKHFKGRKKMKTCLCCILLLITMASIDVRESRGQGIHIIAGQAGVNPGAGLFTIAEKEGLYKKNGLDAEIIQTNTIAAVSSHARGENADCNWRRRHGVYYGPIRRGLTVFSRRLVGKCFPL